MCYTCGCQLPYDNHGDNHNLIEDHFHDAGQTEAIQGAGKKTAKENTLELLQMQRVSGELENPRQDYKVHAAAPLVSPGFQELGEALAIETVSVMELISDWPEASQEAAKLVVDKYGAPDEISDSVLIWHQTGPWKRLVAYRDLDHHDFPAPHYDAIESFIEHSVPINKIGSIVEFDGSVVVNRTKGELSARCYDEEAVFLTLNLANDIMQGHKSVQEAKDYYAKEYLDYRKKEPTPYMEGLNFTPTGQGDRGERLLSDEELKKATQHGQSKER